MHVPMKRSSVAVVCTLFSSYSLLLLTYNSPVCNAFGVLPFLHLPSPEIVTWTQQHVITTATSTIPHAKNLPDLFALYQNALHTLPLQTQMITGALLAVAGDTTAQFLDKKRTLDLKRTMSFAAFDACYRAVQHILYPPMKNYFHGQFLYPAISSLLPTSNAFDQHHNYILSAAAEQSLISQLVVIPLLYYPIFFVVTGMVQGLSLEQSIDRGVQSFIPLMQRNLLFWIPVQFGVFGYINDDALQISVLIACGFIWTMILSAFAGSVDTATTTAPDQLSAASTTDEPLDVYTAPVIDSDTVEISAITPTVHAKMAYASVSLSNSTGINMMMTQEDQLQLR